MSTDPCPFCSKKFVGVEYLAQHVQRRHSDESTDILYDGPGGGIDQDSEGEIRTSRLERQKALWTPQTELEREMSGARESSAIRSTMRLQRAREHSPGFWPVIIDTSSSKVDAALEAVRRQAGKKLQSDRRNQYPVNDGHSSRARVTAPDQAIQAESRLTWPSVIGKVSVVQSSRLKSGISAPSIPVVSKVAPASGRSQVLPHIQVTNETIRSSRNDQPVSTQTFATCPLEECGEQVLLMDIDDHIERHQAEQLVLEGDDPSSGSIGQDTQMNTQSLPSLPVIARQHGRNIEASRSEYSSQPVSQIYRQSTSSGPDLPSAHSYYAPEKSGPPPGSFNMNYTRQTRNFQPAQIKTEPSTRLHTLEPQPIITPNTHRVVGDYGLSILPVYNPSIHKRRHQGQRDESRLSDSHRPQVTHLSLSAEASQARPKSAMAVLCKSESVLTSTNNKKTATEIRDGSIIPTAVPRSPHLQKRQSEIESAISEVKDRVSSWSLMGTVDGFERGLRASREKQHVKHLSKHQLGPYAYEQEMPSWLYKQLRRGPRIYEYKSRDRDGRVYVEEIIENETPGIVPMLARLSELDSTIERAYFCHPATTHVSKMRSEGGFCGYRNIQMQVSYLQGAKAEGHASFPGRRLPGILQLQDSIEAAWDAGHFTASRREIGQLRGTRKWIGSIEAHALFKSLAIPCDCYTYINDSVEGRAAHEDLFVWTEAYFRSHHDEHASVSQRIHRTLAPPVYLQHPGHSLTVVGYEVHKNGQRNLVVLDPMYITSKAMDQLLDAGPRRIRKSRNEILQVYRRHESDFRKYGSIETLNFASSAPKTSAWDIPKQHTGRRSSLTCDFTVVNHGRVCEILEALNQNQRPPFVKTDLFADHDLMCSSSMARHGRNIWARDRAWKGNLEERDEQWQLRMLNWRRRSDEAELRAAIMRRTLSAIRAKLPPNARRPLQY